MPRLLPLLTPAIRLVAGVRRVLGKGGDEGGMGGMGCCAERRQRLWWVGMERGSGEGVCASRVLVPLPLRVPAGMRRCAPCESLCVV